MNYKRVEITLNDGRRISCICYIVSSSDRGALIYTPSDRATRNFIRVAENEGRKLFGDHPVIVVPPTITYDAEERPNLPPYRFVGEFTSAPFDDTKCWSTAIIVWYQNAPYPVIGKDVETAFRQIEWNTITKDENVDL